jgi:hypothetical protein
VRCHCVVALSDTAIALIYSIKPADGWRDTGVVNLSPWGRRLVCSFNSKVEILANRKQWSRGLGDPARSCGELDRMGWVLQRVGEERHGYFQAREGGVAEELESKLAH